MPPVKLYKYRSLSGDSFKYTQSIFLRREFLLPKISTFNDPFEGRFSIEHNTHGQIQDFGFGPYNTFVSNDYIKDQAHVYCLSEVCDHILMWSHYSSSHTGICIEFDTNVNDSPFQDCKAVSYVSNINTFTVNDIAGHSLNDFVEHACLFKAEQWAYERE